MDTASSSSGVRQLSSPSARSCSVWVDLDRAMSFDEKAHQSLTHISFDCSSLHR